MPKPCVEIVCWAKTIVRAAATARPSRPLPDDLDVSGVEVGCRGRTLEADQAGGLPGGDVAGDGRYAGPRRQRLRISRSIGPAYPLRGDW